MTVPASTPRFHLRAPTQEDADLYARLYTDAGTMQHVAPPWSQAHATATFANVLSACAEPRFRYRLWVVATHGGEPVGVIALMGDATRAELGMMVLPAWRGCGAAQEVVPSVTAYAFDRLGVSTVAARHVVANRAGARVMQALGFHPETDSQAGWQGWACIRQG